MASQTAAKMATPYVASSSTGKVTLQSVLSDSRQTLATIQNERLALQQDLLRKVQDINQTVTGYWIAQAKSLSESVRDAGRDVDEDEWQANFATQETARAKTAAAKQKELWSQIEGMVKEAKDHDDKFWATWQNSLNHFGAAHKSNHQGLVSSGAKSSVRPRREERPTRATAKKSAPRGPTAFTTKRANSLLTKFSKPESAKPSTLSSSGSRNPVRGISSVDESCRETSSTSSSLRVTAPANSTPKVRKEKTTTRHEKKQRTPRKIAAKNSSASNSMPDIMARSAKRRGLQQVAKSPVNPNPVLDPKPGQLYQAYYHSANIKERGWYMGTVLPWKSSDWAEETMIDFSMRDMDLTTDWPDCCQPGFETKAMLVNGSFQEVRELTCIKRWMPGFEDGGPRVMERKFLFLFFEDRPKRLGCLNIDPTQPMSLIQFNPMAGEPVPIDWVDAKHLRLNTDDARPVWGSLTAEKYRNKLDHVARLRQQARVPSKPTSQQHIGGYDGTTDRTMVFGPQQDVLGGHVGAEPLEPRVDGFSNTFEVSSALAPTIASYAGTPVDGQQNASTLTFLDTDSAGVPGQQRPSHQEPRSFHLSAFSPAQMEIDEAYEEPQTYTKRTTGKRSLSNDDEYDEGLGMDYDLNLKRSATQMSRLQTSIVGPPPHKLPRLDDYNVPGSSSSGSGIRSPGVGYIDAKIWGPAPETAARSTTSSSPTGDLMGHFS